MADPITWNVSAVENRGLGSELRRVLAVNWMVAPVANTAGRDLLRPWKWQVQWHLYWKSSNDFVPYPNGATIGASTPVGVLDTDADSLRTAIDNDVSASIATHGANAFSDDASLALGEHIAIPAIFAGLSHAPAAISGSILKLSDHALIEFPDNTYIGGQFTLVPSITIGADTYVPPGLLTPTGTDIAFDCISGSATDPKLRVLLRPFDLGPLATTEPKPAADELLTPGFLAWCATTFSLPRLVSTTLDQKVYSADRFNESIALARNVVRFALESMELALDPLPTAENRRTLLHDLFNKDWEDAAAGLTRVDAARVNLHAHALALAQPVAAATPTEAFLKRLKDAGASLPPHLKGSVEVVLETTLKESQLLSDFADPKTRHGAVNVLYDALAQVPIILDAIGGSGTDPENAAASLVSLLAWAFDGQMLGKDANLAADRRMALMALFQRNLLGHARDPTSFLGKLLDPAEADPLAALNGALTSTKAALQSLATPPARFLLTRIDDTFDPLAQQGRERLTPGAGELPRVRHDTGLDLVLPGSARSTKGFDARRGYAVALGSKVGDSQFSSVWITQAMARIERNGPFIRDASYPPKDLWLHDTAGAVKVNGVSNVWLRYDGAPKNAIIVDVDATKDLPSTFPQFKPGMYRIWPSSEAPQLPILGFGIEYSVLAVPIDNAGGTELPRVATAPDAPAQLVDVRTALDAYDNLVQKKVFLSVEPVAGPTVVFGDLARASEVANDTFCHLWLAQQQRKPPNQRLQPYTDERPAVAVLVPGAGEDGRDEFAVKNSAYDLGLRGPRAHATFLERWLNFEIAARKLKPSLTDDRLAKATDEQINVLVERLAKERASDSNSQKEKYHHPGVNRYRLVVDFGPIPSTATAESPDLFDPATNGFFDLLDRKGASEAAIRVNRGAANGAHYDAGTFKVTLAPGSFARITLQSGVPERFFKGDARRIHEGVMKEGIDSGFRYFYFGDTSVWCESVAWPKDGGALPRDLAILDVNRDHLRAVVGSVFTGSAHGGDPRYIRWARSLTMSRHEWHWVGPPLEPERDLADKPGEWLHAYANVASLREEEVAPLHAEHDGTEWRIPVKLTVLTTGVLKDIELPRWRGARHTALAVSLMARFRAWLTPSAIDRIESPVWQTAKIVPGRMGSRPDAPRWQLAVPLAETRDEEGDTSRSIAATRRAPNGVVLVFDEALYRTDSQATGGGIGEAYDVDVVATWPGYPKDGKKISLAEAGPNPIFEPKPDAPALSADTFVRVSRPFGLTHDIGTNPLVASTAVVATAPPSFHADQWVLAKLRTRKLIWPHLLLDNSLDPDSKGPPFVLKGDPANAFERPNDFAVYGDIALGAAVTLEIDSKPVELLAGAREKRKVRILCTMHKARWRAADSVPTWRWQITVYQREGDDDVNFWRAVRKIPPQETEALPARVGAPVRAGGLVGKVDAYELLASDYSEARWVSFIGLLGNGEALAAPAQDFRLSSARSLMLERTDRGVWLPEPNFRLVPPEESAATCFQLALIFRPTRDALRGYLDRAAGMPLGFWKPIVDAGQLKGFDPIFDFTNAKPQPGDQAYIISFQRRNTGASESMPGKWEEFVQAMFPVPQLDTEDAAKLTESRLRMLPQYLGPIPIV